MLCCPFEYTFKENHYLCLSTYSQVSRKDIKYNIREKKKYAHFSIETN